MTNYKLLRTTLLLLTLPLATHAHANEIAEEEPDVQSVEETADVARIGTGGGSFSGAGVDAYARESIVAKKGSTQLGTGLAFQTSRAGLEGSPVYFTDVAMFHPYLRISVHDDVEISAEGSILAKQTQGENSVVQSGTMGLIYGIGSHYAAYAKGSSGSLYDRKGNFLGGSVGMMARKKIEDFLMFEGDVSGGMLELSSESLGHNSKVDLAEVSAGGKIVGMTPGNFHYGAGGWIGARFSFPVLQRGDLDTMSMSSSASMDIQPSLDVTLGGVVRMREWDLWMSYSIIDRGDASKPETTLPILGGGFDQTQTTVGVTRRFGHAKGSKYGR